MKMSQNWMFKKNESNFLYTNKQDKFNHIFENKSNIFLIAYFKIFQIYIFCLYKR